MLKGLKTIITAILVARAIFARLWSYVAYRISATLQLLLFFFIAVFALEPKSFMPPSWQNDPTKESWPTFFSLPVLMLMINTLLNDGTMIAISYDNAESSRTPCVWNLQVMVVIASVIAVVGQLKCIHAVVFPLTTSCT